MFNTSIDPSQAEQFLNALKASLPEAQHAAIGEAVSAVNAQIINGIAADNQLPLAIAARRVKTSVTRAQGKVWLGTLPVSTQYLSPLRQVGHGAMAGPLYFDGAFVVRKYSGRPYLAKRLYPSRYPIIQMVAPIEVNRTINHSVINTSADTYIDVFMDKTDL